MTAQEKFKKNIIEKKFICVGLDTDPDKLPDHIKKKKDAVFEFNKQIIEATYKNIAAYKINFAFYERYGSKGFDSLLRTVNEIPKDILIIGDAKRGDIGNTSDMYAKALYDHFGFDASTLHPLMGEDSLQPFLNYTNKINFLLALTSNHGASDFEKLKLDSGQFVYQRIIEKANHWNKNKNIGIVFGATQLSELKENINSFDDLYVLLPGVGAQGGSLAEVVREFKNVLSFNFLINVSRGIIYKSTGVDFASAANQELCKMNDQINKILFDK
ncbi:MAG: orotidine-5'-phosphate decarboxylase [Ignavibacteriales bacterium]|nr:orotidine-5'-phosphate decarboxylase [Ignavibacteriales bacterium]